MPDCHQPSPPSVFLAWFQEMYLSLMSSISPLELVLGRTFWKCKPWNPTWFIFSYLSGLEAREGALQIKGSDRRGEIPLLHISCAQPQAGCLSPITDFIH